MIKRTYVPYLSGISYEGQPLPPPESIPWFVNLCFP